MGLLSKIYSLLFLFTTCVSLTIIDNISLFSFLFTIRSMYRIGSYYSKESIVPVSTFFISNPIQYCKSAYDRPVRVEKVASVTNASSFGFILRLNMMFPRRSIWRRLYCNLDGWNSIYRRTVTNSVDISKKLFFRVSTSSTCTGKQHDYGYLIEGARSFMIAVCDFFINKIAP